MYNNELYHLDIFEGFIGPSGEVDLTRRQGSTEDIVSVKWRLKSINTVRFKGGHCCGRTMVR